MQARRSNFIKEAMKDAGFVAAFTAALKAATPAGADGPTWPVEFDHDGRHYKFGTSRDQFPPKCNYSNNEGNP